MTTKYGTDFVAGPYTFNAEEAITKGLGVKYGAAEGGIQLADSAGETIYGVAVDDADQDTPVSVLHQGRFDGAIGGASISAGAQVEVTATGRFITKNTGTAVGVAISPCGGNGETFTIELG